MKRFFILFILFTTVSQAQEVKTQKDILQVPKTHLVKDFNFKVKGAIKPVKVIKSTFTDIGFGFEKKSFNYLKKDYSIQTLTFEGYLLKSNINEFNNAFGKPNSFLFYYTYDSNGVLRSSLSKTSNARKLDADEEKNEYSFYPNGLIKESKFIGKTTTTQKYNYNNNKLSYDFANGKTTYSLKNGLVTKSVTFNKSVNQNYTTTFKYNDKGFLIHEDRGKYKYVFELNESNLIEKEIQKAYTKYFKYVYDTYGNWIIAYTLSKSEGSKELYGSRYSFYIRQLTYSNGGVTGGRTPDDSNIKSALLEVRQQLYDELINGEKPYVAKSIRYFDLGLPQTDLVEDFGFKIGKENIVPQQVNKVFYDQRPKRGSTELVTNSGTKSYQTFDTKTKKVTQFNIVRNNKTTYYTYTYDSSGRLITYLSKEPTFDIKENYKYNSDGSFSKETSYNGKIQPVKDIYKKTEYGYISSGISNQKFYFQNNLLQKTVTNYNTKEPSENFNTYNSKGKKIKHEGSFYTNTYDYNSNGDITMLKETSKRNSNVTTRKYAYKYDKYGNWTISMMLVDLSYAQGLPSFPTPTLREITYSNGEKTGTTDITKVEKDLVELRRRVKNVTTNTGNQVATWKKMKEDSFYFYLNNKAVQMAKLSYMGNHILAFIQDNNQLYLMENVQNATMNKALKAQRLNVETSNGYWFKKPNGGVTVFTNQGNAIQKSSLYKYAPNNIDVFYQGEGEPNKVVLKNYKKAQAYTVYPAIPFSQYNTNTNTNTNTTVKRSGTCLKGDCNNGYGEFKHSNGYLAEGFFKNGAPFGPMHVSLEKNDKSAVAFLQGNYQKYKGMQYQYYDNRYTEMVDYNKQMGVLNDAKERKSYQLNFKNGKVVSKTLLKENSNTGCIVGSCYNGAGVYKYKSGSFYFGFFKNGNRHGFGRLTFKDGKEYIGEFDMNTYSGMGTYIISEHNYYMGEFRNNTYNGQGVMHYNKNRHDAGNWSNGSFMGKTQNVSKTNYTNTNNNTITTKFNTNKNTTSFNSFSEIDKNTILACNNDAKCAARYLEKLYNDKKDKLSTAELEKKMTGYFHSLYNINPKMAYSTFFKISRSTMNSIKIKSLPQAIQTDLKNRAQNLMNNYNADMKKKGY